MKAGKLESTYSTFTPRSFAKAAERIASMPDSSPDFGLR